MDALIRSEINETGFMTFERFMDLALYHPRYGYYGPGTDKPRTGRDGDYFTSVSVGPLFGRLLARQFFEAWTLVGRPSPFWIVEQGAEDGALAGDVLRWICRITPEFFSALRYAIIEPGHDSPNRRRQQAHLREGDFIKKIDWFEDWSGLKIEVGVIFSNELLDAFPVHRVVYREGCWREIGVVLGKGGTLSWTEAEIGSDVLRDAVSSLPTLDGYTTEVNLRARAWMCEVGRALPRGYVFTIDYGFPASAHYASHRNNGTLTAYREHRRMENPLAQPGEMDLTAHLDFTALAQAGEDVGLATLGFLDQQHFLLGIVHEELAGTEQWPVDLPGSNNAWNMLTHPNHLGTSFQVLIQGRNAPATLSGLRYGGNGLRHLKS